VRARSSAAALQQLRGREAGEAALWRESRRSGAMARKQAKPGCFLTEQLLHGSALRHCCPFGPVASVASISTLSKKKKKKKKKKTFFSPSTLVLNTFTLLSRPLLSLLFLPKPQRTELDLKGGRM